MFWQERNCVYVKNYTQSATIHSKFIQHSDQNHQMDFYQSCAHFSLIHPCDQKFSYLNFTMQGVV